MTKVTASRRFGGTDPAAPAAAATPGPTAPAPGTPGFTQAIQKSNALQKVAGQNAELRISAGRMRLLASISAAALVTNCQEKALMTALDDVAERFMESIGCMEDDPRRHWMGPVVLRSLSESLLGAASRGENLVQDVPGALGRSALLMLEAMKSRHLRRATEDSFPAMDDTLALRMSVMECLVPVMGEIQAFDFFAGEKKCLSQAMDTLIDTVTPVFARMAGGEASQESARIFMQSLFRSAGHIYAACWNRQAMDAISRLGAMDDAAIEAESAAMAGGGYKAAFRDITVAFEQAFDTLAVGVENEIQPPDTPDADTGKASRKPSPA